MTESVTMKLVRLNHKHCFCCSLRKDVGSPLVCRSPASNGTRWELFGLISGGTGDTWAIFWSNYALVQTIDLRRETYRFIEQGETFWYRGLQPSSFISEVYRRYSVRQQAITPDTSNNDTTPSGYHYAWPGWRNTERPVTFFTKGPALQDYDKKPGN